METDFNRRVRKVLINTLLIVSISIITYLLYSTIEKNRVISEKDKRILIDSMTIIAKVKEMKVLKTAYEKLEMERDSLGLTNDSLVSMVTTLNEFIEEAEFRDSINASKLAQFNIAIKRASVKLVHEKEELKQIEKENALHHKQVPDETVTASTQKKGFVFLQKHPSDNVEVQVERMELEPINRIGKVLTKDQYNSRQIKHIRIKFVIMKSSLTKTVQKIFHVQLIEPDGNLYKFNPEYDYTFVDKNKIHLSSNTKVEFNSNEKQVTFLYPKATPFKPGHNIIQLFCDNKLLSEKEIFIK
jgi:hypothetical protein